MKENPNKPIDYSSGEWLDTLTIYKTGDLVVMPEKHGNKVLTVTKIFPVKPGDLAFAQHSQYVQLNDRFGILEVSVSAAKIKPNSTV